MDSTMLYIVLVVALSFFGETIFGFGSGILAVPLLSILLGVRDAVTITLIFQFCMGLLLWNVRRQIDWKIAHIMTPVVMIGSIGGTLLLSSIPAIVLQFLLLFFIVAYLVKTTWFDQVHSEPVYNKLQISVAGFGGGIFQGLIGTGGTVFIMFLSRFKLSKTRLRATLIYLLFLTSLMRILISAQKGLFTPEIIHITVIAFPLFIISIIAGHAIHHKLNERSYRLGIKTVLFISACALLVKIL